MLCTGGQVKQSSWASQKKMQRVQKTGPHRNCGWKKPVFGSGEPGIWTFSLALLCYVPLGTCVRALGLSVNPSRMEEECWWEDHCFGVAAGTLAEHKCWAMEQGFFTTVSPLSMHYSHFTGEATGIQQSSECFKGMAEPEQLQGRWVVLMWGRAARIHHVTKDFWPNRGNLVTTGDCAAFCSMTQQLTHLWWQLIKAQ